MLAVNQNQQQSIPDCSDTSTEYQNITLTGVGLHTLEVCVDSTNVLNEINENNNCDTFLLYVEPNTPPPPSSPTLNAISNSDGDGNYTVSWTTVSNADTYELQVRESGSGWTPAYNGTDSNHTISNQAIGIWEYQVRAINTGGNSAWSNIQLVTVEPPPPVCHTLNTASSPVTGGNVNVTPAPDCNNGTQYSENSVVSITANPNQTYQFTNWSGDSNATNSTINITMDSNKNVTAHFVENPTCYTLLTTVAPTNSGTITVQPAPNCGATQYIQGTSITLVSAANTNYVFSNWSGAINSTNTTESLVMDGDKNVIASFSPITANGPNLTIPSDLSAVSNSTVNVPITFDNDGNSISINSVFH